MYIQQQRQKLREKNREKVSNFVLGTPVSHRHESEYLEYNPVKIHRGGRRVYHGAFTGGFSAGHHGTVGSEAGWTPASFTSSRRDRAKRDEKHLLDLIDEEDLATNTSLFSVKSHFDANRRARLYQNQSGLGFDIGASVLNINESTLGDKVLHRWGWRPGKSVGKRRTILRPDTEKEVEVFDEDPILQNPPIKRDSYGLGYRLDELDRTRERDRARNLQRDRFGGRIRTDSSNSNAAFGLGALEEFDEHDDPYSSVSKDNYDTSIGHMSGEEDDFAAPLPKKRKSRWGPQSANEVAGYVAAKRRKLDRSQKDGVKKFRGPRVPSDFTGEHVFKSETIEVSAKLQRSVDLSVRNRSSWHSMSLADRQELLGEGRQESAPREQRGVSDQNKKALKERLEGQFEQGTTLVEDQAKGGLSFVAEKKEPSKEHHIEVARDKYRERPEKQERFDRFLAQKMGKKLTHSLPVVQTEFQRRMEEQEFEKVFQELAKKVDFETDSLKQQEEERGKEETKYGIDTRTIKVWKPQYILCKRFNVPYPKFENDQNLQLEDKLGGKKEVSIHDILCPPTLPPEARRPPRRPQLPGNPAQLHLEKLTADTTVAEKSGRILSILSASEQESIPVAAENQDMDLFDAVFNQDSSDEEDDAAPAPRPQLQAPLVLAAKPPPAPKKKIYGPASGPPGDSTMPLQTGSEPGRSLISPKGLVNIDASPLDDLLKDFRGNQMESHPLDDLLLQAAELEMQTEEKEPVREAEPSAPPTEYGMVKSKKKKKKKKKKKRGKKD